MLEGARMDEEADLKSVRCKSFRGSIPLSSARHLNLDNMNFDTISNELKLLESLRPDVSCTYDFNCTNKVSLIIDKKGFSLKDIMDRLKPNEGLIFLANTQSNNTTIMWEGPTHGAYVSVGSTEGTIREWGIEMAAAANNHAHDVKINDLFSTIVDDIARINGLDGRSIPERFVKYNEEFGEFAAEVIKMIGSTQKPYDEDHLVEESADALQCLISIMLDVCKKKNIDFTRVLETILLKDKKWEAKIKEYTCKVKG